MLLSIADHGLRCSSHDRARLPPAERGPRSDAVCTYNDGRNGRIRPRKRPRGVPRDEKSRHPNWPTARSTWCVSGPARHASEGHRWVAGTSSIAVRPGHLTVSFGPPAGRLSRPWIGEPLPFPKAGSRDSTSALRPCQGFFNPCRTPLEALGHAWASSCGCRASCAPPAGPSAGHRGACGPRIRLSSTLTAPAPRRILDFVSWRSVGVQPWSNSSALPRPCPTPAASAP